MGGKKAAKKATKAVSKNVVKKAAIKKAAPEKAPTKGPLPVATHKMAMLGQPVPDAVKKAPSVQQKVLQRIQSEEDAVIAKVMAQSADRQVRFHEATLLQKSAKQDALASSADLFDPELSTMQVAMSGK